MIESESELAEVPRIADGDNGQYYGSTANSKAKMHCLRLSFTQRKSRKSFLAGFKLENKPCYLSAGNIFLQCFHGYKHFITKNSTR